jgi:hypothetical protein
MVFEVAPDLEKISKFSLSGSGLRRELSRTDEPDYRVIY